MAVDGDTNYPTGLDSFDDTKADEDLVGQDVADHSAALTAIEAELGALPSGDADTVRERLETVESTHTIVRGSGIDPTGATDSTTAIQALIDALYTAGGGTLVFPPGTFAVTTLTVVWDASLTVNLVGAGKKATVLTKFGAGTDPILDFSGDPPQLETYSDISNLSILGTSKAHDGIKFDHVARLNLENLDIRACDKAIHNLGGLVFGIDKCTIQSNNIGLYNRASVQDSNIPPSLITVSRSQINSNTTLGIDHGVGQMLIVCDGSNLEENGTSDDLATGGLKVQNTVDDAVGFAQIIVRDTWFENNLGRSVQAFAGDLKLDTVNILGSEDGRAVYSDGNRSCVLSNVHAPSPGDTFESTANTTSVSVADSVINVFTSAAVSTHRFNTQDATDHFVGFFDVRFVKAQASASVKNSSLFRDSADNLIKYKDGSANVRLVTRTPAAANADTSGATLGALETEVNELKALLRTQGLLTP